MLKIRNFSFKTIFTVDPSTGKKIRGQKCEVKDYDQFVFDIYAKYVPQPVDIKTQQSVYDHYDILVKIKKTLNGLDFLKIKYQVLAYFSMDSSIRIT
jgi:hypothetical protein